MMHGPIRRFPRERVESRVKESLPCAWVWQNLPAQPISGLTWMTQINAQPFRADSNAPVLVMLGANNDAVYKELLVHAASGARVYLLVPEHWGTSEKTDPQLLHASKVLIRRAAEVPASAIVTSAGARVWLGGPWNLHLSDEQASALRQSFLRLFWHEGFEEAWTGEKQLLWRVARDRPFDVPEMSRHASVRVGPDVRSEMDKYDAFVHLMGGILPNVMPRKLWFPAGPEHHEQLGKMVQKGTEVLWADRGLPDIVVNSHGAEVVLPGSRARMRIVLTSDQASDAQRILEARAPWSFGVNVRMGESALRAATFWLPGEKKARVLEEQQSIAVSDVQAKSLALVSETLPANWPSPQPLALSVRYQWTVIPPKVPAGAAEDPLVTQWRKLDEEWISRVARMGEELQNAEENQGRLGKLFSRLANALLGFGRTHKSLLNQVTNMAKMRPSSVGPVEALVMLSDLASVEERARRLQGDLDEAERKEREELERDKQRAAWQSSVDEAKRDLSIKRDELVKQEKLVSELAEEQSVADEAMKAADKDAKKDLYAQQKKIGDEITRAKKDVNRLRELIRSLEEKQAEKFEFRPPVNSPPRPTQTGGRFVPQSANKSSTILVPHEALPEVGALRLHKNQRYLVIQQWEDLAIGEHAAQRLMANLVASEDV